MKNFVILFTGLLFSYNANALIIDNQSCNEYLSNYGKSFIFNEKGVEFSIYPDGQFDFYVDNQINNLNININSPGINISFNSGYDYDSYVQYDDYGAIVQIENVPVFYDYYGRIVQAGDVYINYNNYGKISRIGKLYVYYNQNGNFINYNGYINEYNRTYIYRSFHSYFTVPLVSRCVVYNNPYRKYYTPYRCSYTVYRSNYYNGYYQKPYRSRNYYRPSQQVSYYNRGERDSRARSIDYRSQVYITEMYTRNGSYLSSDTYGRNRYNNDISRNESKRRYTTPTISRNNDINIDTQLRQRSVNTVSNNYSTRDYSIRNGNRRQRTVNYQSRSTQNNAPINRTESTQYNRVNNTNTRTRSNNTFSNRRTIGSYDSHSSRTRS